MRSRGQPAGLKALFILATWVAAPVVCAQDALGAIDSCVVKLNADVDIGFERIAARCPDLVRRLDASGWSAWLPLDWKQPGNDLSAGGLRELHVLVARELAIRPPVRAPGVERLGDILASVDQADRERSGWWARTEAWLRAVFDRQERTSSDGWLARMIAQSGPSQAIIQLVSYLALALVVLLAGVIVINELRSSGVFAGRRGRQARVPGVLAPANRPQSLTWSDVDRAEFTDKPRLLLELIVGRLVEKGYLPPARGLTVRELTHAARLPDAHDREDLAALALACERVRFSEAEVPPENIESVVDSGRKLLERMAAGGDTHRPGSHVGTSSPPRRVLMKEKLITLACALGALVLFLTLLLSGRSDIDGRSDIPRPTSEERHGNGYYGALAWLTQENIRTVSLRDRFNKLERKPGLLPKGNLLIVTLPSTATFKTEEFRPLDHWIRAGNTLLVLAALSDNPDWAFALGGFASGDLSLLTGLEFEAVKSREPQARGLKAFMQPQHGTLVPNRPHAYFAGVHEAIALSDYPSQAWTVKVPYNGFVLSLASERETSEGVLWTRPLGDGRIIVSGLGSLFTNRALGLADNARLLANIVGTTVASGGSVLFDDIHQGLGSAYDPAKFYRDRRLYATVGILAALWLCWVFGSARLNMPPAQAPALAPREADLVRATGGFLARVLSSAAGARGLFEHFFRRVGERLPPSRDKSQPPWDYLEGHAGVARADIRQLRDWYAAAQAERRVPLGRFA